MESLRSILIIIAIGISTYFFKDFFPQVWEVRNWYEMIILYLIFILPINVAIIALSLWSQKKDFGWHKYVAFGGLIIGSASLLSIVVLAIRVFA